MIYIYCFEVFSVSLEAIQISNCNLVNEGSDMKVSAVERDEGVSLASSEGFMGSSI